MFWIIGVVLIGVLYTTYRWQLNTNLPPGPWGVPIFGYLPWLNPAEPYKTLTKLSKKYGPIYSVQMGKHFAVVISDPALVRKALAQNELADRTNFEVVNEIMQEHGANLFTFILTFRVFKCICLYRLSVKLTRRRFNIHAWSSVERTAKICL